MAGCKRMEQKEKRRIGEVFDVLMVERSKSKFCI